MMELATQHGRGPVLVESIARAQELSANYIRVLVGGLKSAGLVRAVRGPSGGYELARNPGTVTVLDVITAVEGPLAPVDCVINSSACRRAPACAARDVWCEVARAVDGVLSKLTLEQLAIRQLSKLPQSVNYSI